MMQEPGKRQEQGKIGGRINFNCLNVSFVSCYVRAQVQRMTFIWFDVSKTNNDKDWFLNDCCLLEKAKTMEKTYLQALCVCQFGRGMMNVGSQIHGQATFVVTFRRLTKIGQRAVRAN